MQKNCLVIIFGFAIAMARPDVSHIAGNQYLPPLQSNPNQRNPPVDGSSGSRSQNLPYFIHPQIESIRPSINLGSFTIRTEVPLMESYSQTQQMQQPPQAFQMTYQQSLLHQPNSAPQTYSYSPSQHPSNPTSSALNPPLNSLLSAFTQQGASINHLPVQQTIQGPMDSRSLSSLGSTSPHSSFAEKKPLPSPAHELIPPVPSTPQPYHPPTFEPQNSIPPQNSVQPPTQNQQITIPSTPTKHTELLETLEQHYTPPKSESSTSFHQSLVPPTSLPEGYAPAVPKNDIFSPPQPSIPTNEDGYLPPTPVQPLQRLQVPSQQSQQMPSATPQAPIFQDQPIYTRPQPSAYEQSHHETPLFSAQQQHSGPVQKPPMISHPTSSTQSQQTNGYNSPFNTNSQGGQNSVIRTQESLQVQQTPATQQISPAYPTAFYNQSFNNQQIQGNTALQSSIRVPLAPQSPLKENNLIASTQPQQMPKPPSEPSAAPQSSKPLSYSYQPPNSPNSMQPQATFSYDGSSRVSKAEAHEHRQPANNFQPQPQASPSYDGSSRDSNGETYSHSLAADNFRLHLSFTGPQNHHLTRPSLSNIDHPNQRLTVSKVRESGGEPQSMESKNGTTTHATTEQRSETPIGRSEWFEFLPKFNDDTDLQAIESKTRNYNDQSVDVPASMRDSQEPASKQFEGKSNSIEDESILQLHRNFGTEYATSGGYVYYRY